MGDQGVDGLELFRGRSPLPRVTFQRGGRLIVPQDVADLMGDPPTVELLFNRATRQMAIRPATPDSAFAYPLRHHQRASTRIISGRKFMNHYGIARDVTQRYKATWNGVMLLVDLTQPLGTDERETNDQRAAPDVPRAPDRSPQEPVDARHTQAR